MVFCDIQGSTTAAGQLDPEDWHEIVNGAFEHMISPIYKYEGTIARLMGDGILAFFGAPISHEDDPQRAILSCLEILHGIQLYREKIKLEWGIPVNVRIGINTGLVVVGEVGSDLRMEYTALGDAINLAARMEQTAVPGTIQVSENTHRLVAPIFEFEDLGKIEVKGKLDPVQAYRVLGQKNTPGQIRGIEGLDSPLIGRDAELQTLHSAILELFEGCGQIISVQGEAGLGKSRLISEMQSSPSPNSDERRQLNWLEGRSLSYETKTPYSPFTDLFTQHFKLDSSHTDSEKYERILELGSKTATQQISSIAPYLASMLEIEPAGEDAERIRYLEPPQLRNKVYQAVFTYFETLATQSPLALVLDDVHWIDPTSLELVKHLLPLTEKVPILMIIIFRPRRREPSWEIHEMAARDFNHRYQSILLQPLDMDNSRELVGHLLEVDDLPIKIRTMILEKAEGNPFFVEEVIRSLLDAGLVVRENGHWKATQEIEHISVPDTLSAVITTRLDQLDEDARQVAQTAAVIGRQFRYSILETVHFRSDLLDQLLTDLERRELIREKNRIPHRMYMFKHTLTQETVYESLLLKKRRELHRLVAEYLERDEPDKTNVIAWHFMEAKLPGRALPYLIKAGMKAAQTYSTEEAISLFSQAIDLFDRVDADIPLARQAYEGLGGTLEFAFDYPSAAETYRKMLAFGEQLGDIPTQVSAMNKLAKTVGLGMADFQEAIRLLEKAENLAKTADDLPGLAEGNMIQCAFCTAQADFDGAVSYLSSAVDIGRQLEVDETKLYGLTHIANTYTFMGLFEDAWEIAQEAIDLATRTGHRNYLSELLTLPVPFYHLRNGDLTLAEQTAEEGTNIATQIGSIPSIGTGHYILGYLAHLQGAYQRAIEHYQIGYDSIKGGPMPYMEAALLCLIGTVYLELGPEFKKKSSEYHERAEKLLEQPAGLVMGATSWGELGFCAISENNLDQARTLFDRGLTTPTAMMHLERPKLLIGIAYVNLLEDQVVSAEENILEAEKYIDERSMKHYLPLVRLAHGKLHQAQDELDFALEFYAEAEKSALEMQMRPIVHQSRALSAEILNDLNQIEEAKEKNILALEAINEIEELFESQELRNEFFRNAVQDLQAEG
jgi:class 3 adenylate cyclase/tetratricopeptide (TPR) repeat protein